MTFRAFLAAAPLLLMTACSGGDSANETAPANSVKATAAPAGKAWVDTVVKTPEGGFRMGLQVMNPDGSGRHWLSQGEEHQPDWGVAPPLP